ncbi:MAG: hydroxyisourate hydrolase [Gammaproteobacteria bacterium]|nr:hydroxyisourate hydrolase [Gammaproteobacteria bacterium]
MSGGISVHVVDVTRARPASGMLVEIYQLDGDDRSLVASARLGAAGALDDPVTEGHGIEAGRYEVILHIGDYYRSEGLVSLSPAFLEDAPFRFTVENAAEHYHLPVKMSPWGYSIFRGS